ncbi:hypothetical protein SprV_1002846200 [Sparganum proliferum]
MLGSVTEHLVSADVGDNITKDKSPSRRLRRRECVQFRVEFVSRLGGTPHRRSVDTGMSGNFSIPERKSEAHQATVDALRQTGQPSHDVAMAKVTPASRRFALGQPKEGVAGTHLLQLAFFGESGLSECDDVHLV